jgi:hypothetical protein
MCVQTNDVNNYECCCLLMRLFANCARSKKLEKQTAWWAVWVNGDWHDRADVCGFSVRSDTELCVAYILIVNGFTQSYLCKLYCTGIIVKCVHALNVFVCIQHTLSIHIM